MRTYDIVAVPCVGCSTPTFLPDATCASCCEPPKLADGTYRCCGGLGEHFDGCAIGGAIAAARRFLASLQVTR